MRRRFGVLNGLFDSFGAIHDYQARAEAFYKVGGWLWAAEGYALLLLAEHGPGRGAIVEIGSFMGRSTCYLAFGAKRGGREKVTAIDHFRGSPEMQPGAEFEVPELASEGSTYRVFTENLKETGLSDQVIPLVMSASEAARDWTSPIRLLFIDGDHSYESTRHDFEVFEKAVIPGGIVCFHDVGNKEGVSRFFKELVSQRSEYEHVKTVLTVGILVKRTGKRFGRFLR